MTPTLSILICTLPERKAMLDALVDHINANQYAGKVELIIDPTKKDTTGRKRNKLLQLAQGKYTTFIDDDDWVTDDYVPLILEGAKSNPDVFGIQGIITFNETWIRMLNGESPRWRRKWFISKEFKWTEAKGIYFRYPNHITPMRREIALSAKFPDLYIGEDRLWASEINGYHKDKFNTRIKPSPFKTQYTIQKDIYHYRYVWEKDRQKILNK